MAERLEDYVDVAERIQAFHVAYPEGSLQMIAWEPRQIGDRVFIVYQAAAYRTAGDARPGIGTAWEPFPGPSPFTRDSELMNAETAAWGRACVAVGITASRKLASRQEVQARQQPPQAPVEGAAGPAKPATAPPARKGATEAQRRRIHALITEKAVTRLDLANVLANWDIMLQQGWMDRLSPGRDGTASQFIDELGKFNPSDVPTDPADFTPEQEPLA